MYPELLGYAATTGHPIYPRLVKDIAAEVITPGLFITQRKSYRCSLPLFTLAECFAHTSIMHVHIQGDSGQVSSYIKGLTINYAGDDPLAVTSVSLIESAPDDHISPQRPRKHKHIDPCLYQKDVWLDLV